MSICAQATSRRKAHIVRRTRGVSYTERRLYLQGGPSSLLGTTLGAPKRSAKMGHRSK